MCVRRYRSHPLPSSLKDRKGIGTLWHDRNLQGITATYSFPLLSRLFMGSRSTALSVLAGWTIARMSHQRSQANRFYHALLVGASLPGFAKGGAVIDGGSDDR